MNIILFNPSLRNYLIFNEVLEQHPKLFDYVIEMSSRPHSSTFKKMKIKKILKIFLDCPQFVIMHFLVINTYSILSSLFKTDLKSICKKKNVKYEYYENINDNLINFLKSKQPQRIFNSTPHILPIELIKLIPSGIINFHEAKLPDYRGSASYFWFFINQENEANVTCHYVDEGIDTGEIIYNGNSIKIRKDMSVFNLWFKMLVSHEDVWFYLIPFLGIKTKIPSTPQKEQFSKTYSYPTKEAMNIFKKKGLKFFYIKDILKIFKIAIFGKI